MSEVNARLKESGPDPAEGLNAQLHHFVRWFRGGDTSRSPSKFDPGAPVSGQPNSLLRRLDSAMLRFVLHFFNIATFQALATMRLRIA